MRTLLTAEQVAADLNASISPESVRAARRAGRLASVRVGREHFHTPEQVDAWLEQATTSTSLLTDRSRASISRTP